MCLAVPGKIVQINGDKVVVDYGPEKREGLIIDGDYSVGDLKFYLEALES